MPLFPFVGALDKLAEPATLNLAAPHLGNPVNIVVRKLKNVRMAKERFRADLPGKVSLQQLFDSRRVLAGIACRSHVMD